MGERRFRVAEAARAEDLDRTGQASKQAILAVI